MVGTALGGRLTEFISRRLDDVALVAMFLDGIELFPMEVGRQLRRSRQIRGAV